MIDGCPLPHDDVAFAILDDGQDPGRPPTVCACGLPITYAEDCVFAKLSDMLVNKWGAPWASDKDMKELA